MNKFALLTHFSGLSLREAADFHHVRLDTVKSWSVGRRRAPAAVLDELRALIVRQEQGAAEALKQISELIDEHGEPDEIEIGYPADDHEAHSLGWPCVGAWRAMAARVVAKSPSAVKLVPRGSTPVTAAAADARESLPQKRNG
jgi:hypothetical protein